MSSRNRFGALESRMRGCGFGSSVPTVSVGVRALAFEERIQSFRPNWQQRRDENPRAHPKLQNSDTP